MRRRIGALAAAVFFAAWLVPAGAEEPVRVTVYKTPTCGCCSKWVRHLERAGFSVEAHDLQSLDAIKAEIGVPRRLAACHTALVDGYVVEGHVPAADVRRLLAERPAVKGLIVPGMPHGSPGMESPHPEVYRVFTFDERGKTEVFETHRP